MTVNVDGGPDLTCIGLGMTYYVRMGGPAVWGATLKVHLLILHLRINFTWWAKVLEAKR